MKTNTNPVALRCYGKGAFLAHGYYFVVFVQPMPGPQVGTGSPAVADWWLEKERFGVEETEAAAAPATTTDRTKTRNASFIIGYPLRKSLTQKIVLLTLLW